MDSPAHLPGDEVPRRRFLWVSDVDHTLLGPDPADVSALADLRDALNACREGVWVCLNSSRPVPSIRRSLAEHAELPRPDFVSGAMGTQLQSGDSGQDVEGYAEALGGADWPRQELVDLVLARGGRPHAPDMQTPLKASFDVPDAVLAGEIRQEIEARGLRAKVVFSSGKDLDILPPRAGKATAIAFLRQRLGVPGEQVVVSGDSGNDLDMFQPPYRGIVVANAHSELKSLDRPEVFHAAGRIAAGVLQGLRHHGVLPAAPSLAGTTQNTAPTRAEQRL